MIRRLSELDVEGRRVLTRVDFNVPITPEGTVRDDTRIRAALPTLRTILDRGGRPILMSHLGRPKSRTPMFSLRPVAEHLQSLLGATVHFADDCIGDAALAAIEQAKDG